MPSGTGATASVSYLTHTHNALAHHMSHLLILVSYHNTPRYSIFTLTLTQDAVAMTPAKSADSSETKVSE